MSKASLPRVLLAEENLCYRRVMREALVAFRNCEVDDAATGELAFELSLKRSYTLFLIALTLPDIRGDLLDTFIAKAYPKVHTGTHSAPGVVFLLRPEQQHEWQILSRSARARGHVLMPPRLDMLMNVTSGLLSPRDPLAGVQA